MRCWKSAFNAQGSRLIVVALQVGAVKIYATIEEALKKRKDRVKLSSPQKLRSHQTWMLMFFFWESHPTYDQTQGSSVVFITL